MLQFLADYARSAALVSEPGFIARKVSWQVDVDAAGRFTHLHDLRQGRQPLVFAACPDLLQSELVTAPHGQPRCRFLVEIAPLVLGSLDEETELLKLKRANLAGLYSRAASESSALAWLAPACLFLQDQAQRAAALQAFVKAGGRPRDLVVLTVAGRNPLLEEGYRGWWRSYRASIAQEPPDDQPGKPDLMTGQIVHPTATHPKIKGLPGGLATGDALISFDKPAFTSYGFEQGENGPVSIESATVYSTVLHHLLDHSHALGGLRVCSWSLSGTDPSPLTRLFHTCSAREGTDEACYVLVVSGSSGRVRVRQWWQGQTADLQRAMDDWFEDLSLLRSDGWGGLAANPTLAELLVCLGTRVHAPPDGVACHLLGCAMDGSPLPLALAFKAMESLKEAFTNAQGRDPISPAYALLKTYLRRGGDASISAGLQPQHPDPAYHCGRLLATHVWTQASALGPDLGSFSHRRHFARACSHPSSVFPALRTSSGRHLRRLSPGRRARYERDFAALAPLIPHFPPSLDLPSQALFALGYYHQVAHNRHDIAQRRAARAALHALDDPPESDSPYFT